MRKPFFSIIIPCYNDGRYAEGTYLDRLLNSLCNQGLDKDDFEVILADDCSPVDFSDLIDKYNELINIKYIKTDYNFAPGNTREKGVSIAEGEWIAFADHDDMYNSGALSKVKSAILETAEQYFIFTDFDSVDTTGKVLKKYERVLNWCHGKFYNLDNLWKKYNIHFIKDLKSHEDIAICSQVRCALSSAGINTLRYIPFSSYAWTDNPESVSHTKYSLEGDIPRTFLEVFFSDYIQSTGYIYIDSFKNKQVKMAMAVDNCLGTLLYCYFYIQSFMFNNPENYLKDNLRYAGEYFIKLKEVFNLDADKVYNAVSASGASHYMLIQEHAKPACGGYIPQQTFREWLNCIEESVN